MEIWPGMNTEVGGESGFTVNARGTSAEMRGVPFARALSARLRTSSSVHTDPQTTVHVRGSCGLSIQVTVLPRSIINMLFIGTPYAGRGYRIESCTEQFSEMSFENPCASSFAKLYETGPSREFIISP